MSNTLPLGLLRLVHNASNFQPPINGVGEGEGQPVLPNL